jgi:ABC-type dipeptide/oligopeptide/nickel transport system permease subunit
VDPAISATSPLRAKLQRDRFFQLGLVLVVCVVLAGAIMAEAALSFIGLGAQPPTPSWGAMVADGRELLRVAPWVSFAPGVAIGIAVLGFNLVGEGLREAWDPKLG